MSDLRSSKKEDLVTGRQPRPLADPGLLELLGAFSELLGLAEFIQRIAPTDRLKASRRHNRINKLLSELQKSFAEARSPILSLRALASMFLEREPGTIAVSANESDVRAFREGMRNLRRAIERMTNVAYELEEVTKGLHPDQTRFHLISERGRGILGRIQEAMKLEGPTDIDALILAVDQHLKWCDEELDDRRRFVEPW